MKDSPANSPEFLRLADHAADNVFTFAEFVEMTQQMYSDSPDEQALEVFRTAWHKLEALSAVALRDWENSVEHGQWKDKWREKYQARAIEIIGMIKHAALRFA